jgi:hypothetical protein
MKNLKKLLLAVAMVLPVMAMATGAIAVDDQEGDTEPGYGISSGQADKAAAQRVALSECKKAGNKSCKVVVWFEGCGAYAASSKYFGVGYGKTQAIAEKKALAECGKSSCEVKVSDCDE